MIGVARVLRSITNLPSAVAEYDFLDHAVTDRLTDISVNANHGTFGNSGGSYKPTQGTVGINFDGTVRVIRLPIAIHSTYRSVIACFEVRSRDQIEIQTLLSSTSNTGALTVDANGDVGYWSPDYANKKLVGAVNQRGNIVIGFNTPNAVANDGRSFPSGRETAGYLARATFAQEVPGADEFWIGCIVNNANGVYVGNIYYMMFWDVILTPLQMQRACEYVRTIVAARGVAVGDEYGETAPRVFIDGDSLTVGSALRSAGSVPFHVQQGLLNGTCVTNCGVWGTTAETLRANLATRIIPALTRYYAAGATNLCYVLEIGTNDLSGLRTPAEVYADMVAVFAAVRAVSSSIKTVLCTLIERFDTSEWDEEIIELNNLIRAGEGFDADYDVLADYQANAGLVGGDYAADQLHLIDSGYAKEATVLLSVLTGLGYEANLLRRTDRLGIFVPHPRWCFKDAAGTLPAGDGDAVYVWRTQGPGNYRFVQTDSDKRPLLKYDSSAGLWYLLFDSTDDGMTCDSIPISASCTICYNGTESLAGSNTRVLNGYSVNGVFSGRRTSFGFYVNGTVKNSPGIADANRHTVTIKKTAAGNWALRIDGVDQTGLSAVTTDWGTGIYLGCGGGFTEPLAGKFYGMTIYGANLVTTELTNLETFVATPQ